MSSISNWLDSFYDLNPGAISEENTRSGKKDNILPLSSELTGMDFGDKDFYSKLTDEQKKAISLWVLMRYMSSSQNDAYYHLTIVNDVVNTNFAVISKHPELQWKLLALCGTRKKQFHTWIPPGKKAKKNRLEEALIEFFPLMKDSDLKLLQQINTQEDFVEFFRQNAFDDKTIKEIFKGDKGK